ncbi:PQQ-binding-like beta-propeller repeat protein [Muricoccus radiodurans]|uniref:outer membrane protein assembly factor BamB family protein n=1 Tax=Muricoccus radiodurans TaxID=2231721 RepID=UPI003CF39AFA
MTVAAPTDAITTRNVGALRPVLSWTTDSVEPHTAAPVAADGVLILLSPFPHGLQALDPSRPASPLRWRYAPPAERMARGRGCCGATGGLAIAGDRVFLTTVDGRAVALDAATGRAIWEVQATDPGAAESLAAPVLAGERVIIGSAGDDFGMRGWVEAREAATGHVLWRRYSTGPDSEAGIGPAFHPFYRPGERAELGQVTWPPAAWQQGGGGVSGGVLWDGTRDLLFHGTGPAAPVNPARRAGDNRWTAGLFARDAATGEARWFTGISPHDPHALGSATAILSAEIDWQGARRSVLVHPDPNGHVYLLDPSGGQILSAEPFVPVNTMQGLDLATGVPRWNDGKRLDANGMLRDVCPGRPGALGGPPAFLPATGLLYLPASRLCMDIEYRDTNFIRGTPYTGANVRLRPPASGARGALVAWDVAAARPAWTVEEPFPLGGGALATEEGLVFYGTRDGWLKALDARSGAELWRFRLRSGVVSQPVAFRGADGRPYLAVVAGDGRGAGREIDMRDASAANGLAQALSDLPPPQAPGGVLTVFGLP